MSRTFRTDVPTAVFDDLATNARGVLFLPASGDVRVHDILVARDRSATDRYVGLRVQHVVRPGPDEPVDLGDHVALTVFASTRLMDNRLVELVADDGGHRNGCGGCDFDDHHYPPCWTADQVREDQRLVRERIVSHASGVES